MQEIGSAELAGLATKLADSAVAHELATVLEARAPHPVEVTWPLAQNLHNIYVHRRNQWLLGKGASTAGITEFVQALKKRKGPIGLFTVSDGGRHYIGVIDATATHLIGVTAVWRDSD